MECAPRSSGSRQRPGCFAPRGFHDPGHACLLAVKSSSSVDNNLRDAPVDEGFAG
jgi:hypothetical protein